MATLELRPRSATEIIDASFQLLRANYGPLVTLSVAAQLPIVVIYLLVLRSGPVSSFSANDVAERFVPILAYIVVLGALGFVAQCAVMVAMSQVYLGVAIDAGAALRRALARFGWMLLTYVLLAMAGGALGAILFIGARGIGSGGGVVVSTLLLVCVMFYLMVRLALLGQVLVLEDSGPIESVRRTWWLGSQLFGHILLTIVLAILIYAGIFIIGQIVLLMVTAVLPALKDQSVASIFQAAVSAVISPFIIAIVITLYYDLRIRREGFDLEMMSRATPR